MTCIVGLIDNGSIYMGGDSAGVAGLSISVRLDEKVFQNGPMLIGGTTSFRMLQLLRYKLDPPKQTVSQDDMKYMCTDFIDSVRKCFTDNEFGYKDERNAFNDGGNFLVGYNGKLYQIWGDFQVGISSQPFDAVGCGKDLALGAMYVNSHLYPEERIKLALEVASTFNAGVVAPFIIKKLI